MPAIAGPPRSVGGSSRPRAAPAGRTRRLAAAAALAGVAAPWATRCLASPAGAARGQPRGPVGAVIFDCDGTLLDTETAYLEAFNRAVSRYYRGPREDVLQSPESWGRDFVGRGGGSAIAVARFGLGCTAREFDSQWTQHFGEIIAAPGSVRLLRGFDELYLRARARGVPVAVASSTSGATLRKKLSNLLLEQSRAVGALDDFDVIISNDNVTKFKPDPEIYLLAARTLGIPPEACLVVEDSLPGVRAGKAAGMRVVAVPNRYTATQDFSSADHVVVSMLDIVGML